MTAPDDSVVTAGEEPVVRLRRWTPTIDPDDPHAAYKHAVAGSSLADPLATLAAASENLGIPVGALARHVLAEWASAGAAALLELGPSVVSELADAAKAVDVAPAGLARDAAWAALRGRIEWLAHGVDDPEGTYPGGGAGSSRPVARRRVGVYGLAVHEGAALLCQVADGYPGAGRWTLPGGGLEHGEDPFDGLMREVTEETGLFSAARDFLIADSHHLVSDDADLHLLRLVWRIDVTLDREPRVLEVDGSTAQAAWIGPAELAELPLLSVAAKALRAAGLRPPPPDRSDGAV